MKRFKNLNPWARIFGIIQFLFVLMNLIIDAPWILIFTPVYLFTLASIVYFLDSLLNRQQIIKSGKNSVNIQINRGRGQSDDN